VQLLGSTLDASLLRQPRLAEALEHDEHRFALTQALDLLFQSAATTRYQLTLRGHAVGRKRIGRGAQKARGDSCNRVLGPPYAARSLPVL
jgi:hypothetical protein